jgi:hypothetical protein
MRIWTLTCAAVIAAVPASARGESLRIELQLGHPVYHEREQEAGVAMGLSITPDHNHPLDLRELCEELRRAAGLGSKDGNRLRLETIFVVPRKGMAVEGYYFPNDGTVEEGTLVLGTGVPRGTLDSIVARAGIPPRFLDETNVEHEVSCAVGEPLWRIAWYDVRDISDEDPDTVIERAHQRFMAIHQAVVEHNTEGQYLQKAQRTTRGG